MQITTLLQGFISRLHSPLCHVCVLHSKTHTWNDKNMQSNALAQALTNCMQGYKCAHNTHANSITHTHYFLLSIGSFFKDNLNLAMSFLVASSRPLCCHTRSIAALIFLFVCFHRNDICSPVINQTSPSQYKGWFPHLLICRW